MTLIEEVAEGFVHTVLKDHPIMLYQLDDELSEFISNNKEIERKLYANSSELREYLKSPRGQQISAEINQEVISQADVLLKKGELPYRHPKTTFYTESEIFADNLLLYHLVHLVLRNENTRVRRMHEIEEEEMDHPTIPNMWIYHKDSDLDGVLDYIKEEYDAQIKFDEQFEEGEEDEGDSYK